MKDDRHSLPLNAGDLKYITIQPIVAENPMKSKVIKLNSFVAPTPGSGEVILPYSDTLKLRVELVFDHSKFIKCAGCGDLVDERYMLDVGLCHDCSKTLKEPDLWVPDND